ncbi:MAG TPA: amino acid racemase [Candidatus Tectomicrobia bacterium]|nr:amino acid racemase [Candidatus Tectomicrobia bacterium]
MKRIGVLGGISAQATMDFEARVHRVSQQLIPQYWNQGYPPMVVWYHRRPPIRVRDDGQPYEPREIDPELVEAARWLGKAVDFIVIPCNAAHVGAAAIQDAAGCPVLSMIDLAVEDVARRGYRRVGVIGFKEAPAVYLDPLRQRGIRCETIDAEAQGPLDAAIVAVAEGRDGPADAGAARAAVAALRARGVDGVVLGCTEIPLLLAGDGPQPDLVDPVALLAEAAVRFAIEDAR